MMTSDVVLSKKVEQNSESLTNLLIKVLKPNTTSMAYALFLASNAAIVWGGVFPFIPLDYQTRLSTITFFFAQSSAFALMMGLVLAFLYTRKKKRTLYQSIFIVSVTPYFLGWICLVATMYLRDYAQFITVLGGVLIGVGAACFLLLWVWTFSAMPKKKAAFDVIQGFLYFPIFYIGLNIIPQAVTVFLMPALFGPLSFFGLLYAMKGADFTLAHFSSYPRKNPVKYRQVLADCFRNVLGIATFGFACGSIRSIAINDVSVGLAVNNISMVGAFVCAGVLAYLWNFKTFKFNLNVVFMVLYPVITIGFFFMPFFSEFSDVFILLLTSVLYAIFMGVLTLTIIQCIQISYARVIHPIFIFGVYGGMLYMANDFGFISGQFAELLTFPHISTLGSLSLLTIFVTSIMFYVGVGGWKTAKSTNPQKPDYIDLVASGGAPETRNRPSAGDFEGDQILARDRIDMQCRALAAHFGLSDREREIVELIVRGNTTKHIANELQISENTVLTHRRRLYIKLDIHKKQELCDTVNTFSPYRAREDDNNRNPS